MLFSALYHRSLLPSFPIISAEISRRSRKHQELYVIGSNEQHPLKVSLFLSALNKASDSIILLATTDL